MKKQLDNLAQEVLDIQHELFTLPTRYGGVVVQNPIESYENYHDNSRHYSDKLTTEIKQGKPLDLNNHIATSQNIKKNKQDVSKNI